jgi:hypothetical protein
MKTVNDFNIKDGVVVLEGVAYAEEARVVDEFLKVHTEIKLASVFTNDQRSFRLDNGKLVLTNDKTFINPYFDLTTEDSKSILYPHTEKTDSSNLEQRIIALEKDLLEYESLLKSILSLLTKFIEK